jgi:hypothetical protein
MLSLYEGRGSLDGMTYAIFDLTGNLMDAFDDRSSAEAELLRLAAAAPDEAHAFALVTFDDRGRAVGDALTGEDALDLRGVKAAAASSRS